MQTYTIPMRVRRVKLGGSGIISLFCAIVCISAALAGFFVAALILWPLSFIAFLGAILTETKYGLAHYCGECGNEVAPTSRLCPHCQANLLPPTRKQRSLLNQLAIALFILGLIVIIYLYLNRHHGSTLP